MKRTAGRLLAALAALTVVSAVAVADDESGFVPLFDGKTLAGWAPEFTEKFAVRGGVIVNDGGTGWLRTSKPYKDFEFRAEYRAWKKGADSGLFFRATARSTEKAPHWCARGYQLQVIDADSHFMLFGHGTPARFDRKTDALRAAMKGPGEWQAVGLKVVGRRAEATLNGRLVTVSDAITVPEGFLGLQGEHGRFEWRALRIKEFPAR